MSAAGPTRNHEDEGSSSSCRNSSTTAGGHHEFDGYKNSFSSEIDLDGYSSSDLFEITEGLPLQTIKEDVMENSSMFSYHDVFNAQDSVYVAVGKRASSLDALSWTLKNAIFNSSTTVFLIHVYPNIRLIPSPIGMLPKSQVSPELVEGYLEQEKAKRKKLLQKFLNMCSAYKVKVDTILVENDLAAKAILDLIPIFNIKKLVLGISKASLRKAKSKRAHGIADKVLLNAPQSCDVTIICEEKEVLFEQMIDFPSPPPLGSEDYTFPHQMKEFRGGESFASCMMCFKPKVFDP